MATIFQWTEGLQSHHVFCVFLTHFFLRGWHYSRQQRLISIAEYAYSILGSSEAKNKRRRDKMPAINKSIYCVSIKGTALLINRHNLINCLHWYASPPPPPTRPIPIPPPPPPPPPPSASFTPSFLYVLLCRCLYLLFLLLLLLRHLLLHITCLLYFLLLLLTSSTTEASTSLPPPFTPSSSSSSNLRLALARQQCIYVTTGFIHNQGITRVQQRPCIINMSLIDR